MAILQATDTKFLFQVSCVTKTSRPKPIYKHGCASIVGLQLAHKIYKPVNNLGHQHSSWLNFTQLTWLVVQMPCHLPGTIKTMDIVLTVAATISCTLSFHTSRSTLNRSLLPHNFIKKISSKSQQVDLSFEMGKVWPAFQVIHVNTLLLDAFE